MVFKIKVLNEGKRILWGFYKKRLGPKLTIQRNWKYKIQVFEVAAKTREDKTKKKDSEDEKQSQQVRFSVLKYII